MLIRAESRQSASFPLVEPLEKRQLMSVATSAPALHLLFYGASYTNGYQPGKGDVQGLPTLLSQLAVAAGYAKPIVSNQSTDGKTLDYALSKFSASKVSSSTNYVIFQDQSERMSSIKGVGDVADSEKEALALFNKVKAIAPNVVPVMFEDWGRAVSDTAELKKWYPTLSAADAAKELAAEIKKNTATEAAYVDKGKTLTARVGDAFSDDGLAADLFASDHHHATNEGYMLSALVFLDTIYGVKSAKLKLTSVFSEHGISATIGAKIEKLADAVA